MSTDPRTREALEARIAELERQVASLQTTARRYEALVSVFPHGISISDAEGRIIESNEAAARMLGLDRERHESRELDGPEWRIIDLQGEDLPAERWASVVALRERRAVLHQEMGVERGDGAVTWLDVSAAPMAGEGGGVVVTYHDISERRRSREALREREEELRRKERMLERTEAGAHIGSWQWEIATKRFSWSDELGRILDVAPEERLSPAERLGQLAPEALEKLRRLGRRAVEDHEPFESSLELPRSGGPPRRLELCGFVEVGDHGAAERLYGFVQDVTEKAQMVEELRLSEERLSLALHGARDGLWDWDLTTDEVFYSTRWKEMLGYEEQEVTHHLREWQRLVSPDDRERVMERIRAYLAGELPSFECEFRMRHKDGSWVDVLARAFAIRDERDGSPTRLIGTHVDVTERKRMERRLQRAQRMESLGNLAGGIAHDFNNLLAPIMGFAELLLADLEPGSEAHDSALEILAASARGRDVVERILAFSRKSMLEKAPLHLPDVLAEVVRMGRSSIPADIEIVDRSSSRCGLVLADGTQIHQVAMNLITNAYHAIEPGSGRIVVALDEHLLTKAEAASADLPPGRYARLRVSDDGRGVAPEHMDKLFEPYFTTKEQGKGTGIGLSTVYGIVKEHHGGVAVESAPGQTTFTVYLPLAGSAARAEPALAAGPSESGREHLLLVDDDPAIRQLLRRSLERLGYLVTAYESSHELLRHACADPLGFDLVLTDMTMPEMTGDLLARELLALRPELPIIICTGFSERIDEAKAKALGVRRLLMKPVRREALARAVREALDASR